MEHSNKSNEANTHDQHDNLVKMLIQSSREKKPFKSNWTCKGQAWFPKTRDTIRDVL